MDVRSNSDVRNGFAASGGDDTTLPRDTQGDTSSVGMRMPRRSNPNWSGYYASPSPGGGTPTRGGGTWS